MAEAARNVACAGALPIGATNNLNFGNPEKPEIMWQFAEAVAGIGEACRALDIPITGGNVSLYNETDGKADPADARARRRRRDRRRLEGGDAHVQAGRRQPLCCWATSRGELGGSEYLKTLHGLIRGVGAGAGSRRRAAAAASAGRSCVATDWCSRPTTARRADWP